MESKLVTRFNLLVALALGGLAAAVTFLFLLSGATLSVQADYGILYVAPGGICGGVSPCYGSVQAAVDAAAPGDEIRVAAGTYADVNVRSRNDVTTTGVVTQVVYITKTITLRGGYTTTNWTMPYPVTQPTTLDAQAQGRGLYIAGSINCTVEGLLITGGNTVGMGYNCFDPEDPWSCSGTEGGGIYAISATVTVKGSQIYSNSASSGGGLFLRGNSATVIGNTFISNTVGGMSYGGGLWAWQSNAIIEDNSFIGNKAYGGGGLSLHSGSISVRNNLFISNSATIYGGGIFVTGSDATISGNRIIGNRVTEGGHGGGVSIWGGQPTLVNNVIVENRAPDGCGVAIDFFASPRLIHNTLARNYDSYAGDSGIYGIGISVNPWSLPYNANATIINTILVSQSVGIDVTGGSTVTVNGILWFDTPITVWQAATATVTVQNEHWGAPAFAADGYYITPASAAIDAGVDAGVTTDINGHYRPFGAAPDLGADEWATTETTAEPSTAATLVARLGNLTTTVQIPPGAVTENTVLAFTALAVATHTLPSDLAFANHAFDLNAYRNDAVLSGFTFNSPVTITLQYTETDVTAMDETKLGLEYWNDRLDQWEDAATTCLPSSTYDRHPNENWLAVSVCHLSQFALFGEQHRIYLPLVLRNW